ncbi:hypothetical protein PIB30_090188 [Stylosanthes scabra]|uniref:Aminotransferase-like plant mobile domain-containing protein n=1 Tax=Stylosanthes scabra TaxID=79078 RepID=A0ABU6SUM0_9FABA|nr:hypothetical protein [Stylosanthes scabra]
MGCQVSIFEVRRCAFGDKLYGIAENYGREGVDVEVNSSRSPEIGLWDSMSNKVNKDWASRPVRNIAPTRELESFGPSLRLVQTSAFFIFKVFSIAMLSVVVRELYGWVDEEIFTQPSVVEADALLELRHEMRLTVDWAAEGDYVLEATGPSDRLPLRAQEDKAHYLWVYSELFTRFGVRLPFTNFQREVLSRYQVAASQLHLNGWGFLRTFERGCLHFGFRPSWRIFLYTYQLHAPPPGRGFMSFRAYQGRKLFDSFEESIQEFKWHYFKVLPLPDKRPFWLDDKGVPFSWVYWNAEVGDFCVTALDPLETLAFEFLQSLLAGLGKKSNFKCRWILGHNDADVGAFLDSFLKDMEKQSRFDRLMQRMKEVEGEAPRSILPSSKAQTTVSGASASGPIAPASISASSIPPAPSSGASKATGKSTSAAAAKPFSMEREEGVKEDLTADLRQKRRKRKVSEASAEEAALGGDSTWKHKANPIDRAFPPDYNFRAALDAGLTNAPTREILGPLVPEQLLGTAQFLACQLTACLQVRVENTFAAKVQLEKELAAAKEQVDVLIAERDSALAAPLLHAKIK